MPNNNYEHFFNGQGKDSRSDVQNVFKDFFLVFAAFCGILVGITFKVAISMGPGMALGAVYTLFETIRRCAHINVRINENGDILVCMVYLAGPTRNLVAIGCQTPICLSDVFHLHFMKLKEQIQLFGPTPK